MGYHRAGFDEIVGVDINPQPHYPFEYIRGDALAVLSWIIKHGTIKVRINGMEKEYGPFDAICGSPPCQFHTTLSSRWRGKSTLVDQHLNLLQPSLDLLRISPYPYVIENVVGARKWMRDPIVLHGGMFHLGVHRPRLFEASFPVFVRHAEKAKKFIGVYGARPDGRLLNSRTPKNRAALGLSAGQAAMGIDWMPWSSLTQAIPPAYTDYIGTQLLAHLRKQAVA